MMTMKKMHFVVALGGLTILLALWMACLRTANPDALRSSKPAGSGSEEQPQIASLPDPESMSPETKSTPTAERTTQSVASSKSSRPAGLWDRLPVVKGHGDPREAAIGATAAHLAIGSSSLPAFQEAARQSLQELDQALSIRQQEVSAPISSAMAREGRIEMSRQSDARYEAARRSALDRLEPFLNRSQNHLEFRRELDTWASTISTTSRGLYR
jgi:hypothetical protein